MALNANGLNVMANALAAVATHGALHSAAPDSSGSNQTSAARKPLTWGSAASGTVAVTGTYAFTGGAANGAVHSLGLWSALTSGTFYGSFAITGDASFNSAGEYTLDSFSLSGS